MVFLQEDHNILKFFPRLHRTPWFSRGCLIFHENVSIDWATQYHQFDRPINDNVRPTSGRSLGTGVHASETERGSEGARLLNYSDTKFQRGSDFFPSTRILGWVSTHELIAPLRKPSLVPRSNRPIKMREGLLNWLVSLTHSPRRYSGHFCADCVCCSESLLILHHARARSQHRETAHITAEENSSPGRKKFTNLWPFYLRAQGKSFFFLSNSTPLATPLAFPLAMFHY